MTYYYDLSQKLLSPGHDEKCLKWCEHILRFTLVDREEVLTENILSPFPIPSLPNVILGMVVSCLNRAELLNLIAVYPSLADHRFLAESMEISPSLDSIRLCTVTLPDVVKEVTCIGTTVTSPDFRNMMLDAYWKGLLSSSSLEKLATDDMTVLRDVELSTTLTTLTIEERENTSPQMRGINMCGVRLPHSVTNFRLIGSHLRPNDFRPQGGAFYFLISHHLPSVTSLTMRPCPCKEFWDNVNQSFYEKITHLSVNMEYDSFFPLSLTKKLGTLVFSGGIDYFTNFMHNVTLHSLRAFEYQQNPMDRVSSILKALLPVAPMVKILSLTAGIFIHKGRISVLEAYALQSFEYIRVRYCSLTNNLPFFLFLIPRVKCFDIFSHLKVRFDESGVIQVDDDAFFLLKDIVLQHGGRVDILYLSRNAHRSPLGVLRASCRVRVLCDTLFDFGKVVRNHPLLFAHDF